MQKDRAESMEMQQKSEKEIALLEQRAHFLEEKFNEEKDRTEGLNVEN